MDGDQKYLRGRGSQINTHNPFHKHQRVIEHLEGIDLATALANPKTSYYSEQSKSIVNKVDSPDIPMAYSLNPYQGCEHGCIYCYARNSHQYWGFSAGLDFETKIVVKKNAPDLLDDFFRRRGYQAQPIMLSGNTDCYQPIERKLKITQQLLKKFLEFKHPVGIITKNYMILRDLEILKELASHQLVRVNVSITSLNSKLHEQMEPRTAAPFKRLKVVQELSKNGIPVHVLTAPIIPGLNDQEIPDLIKASAEHGAYSVGYIIVRLNGSVKQIFEDWVNKSFPLKAKKILSRIADCHGGQVNDSRFKTRMSGEGKVAEMIRDLFMIHKRKHFPEHSEIALNSNAFRVPPKGQLDLFYETL